MPTRKRKGGREEVGDRKKTTDFASELLKDCLFKQLR